MLCIILYLFNKNTQHTKQHAFLKTFKFDFNQPKSSWGQKNVGGQRILGVQICRQSKKIWGQTLLGVKHFLGLTFFGDQKLLDVKIFRGSTILGGSTFLRSKTMLAL